MKFIEPPLSRTLLRHCCWCERGLIVAIAGPRCGGRSPSPQRRRTIRCGLGNDLAGSSRSESEMTWRVSDEARPGRRLRGSYFQGASLCSRSKSSKNALTLVRSSVRVVRPRTRVRHRHFLVLFVIINFAVECHRPNCCCAPTTSPLVILRLTPILAQCSQNSYTNSGIRSQAEAG